MLIAAWQEWSPTGPDALAASLLLTVGGEAGADPVVHLFGSMLGSETETAALLDEFGSLAAADPVSSEREHVRYGSLKSYLAERGPGDQEDEDGWPYMKSEFFREPLPADAVEALVELFVRGRRRGEARKLTSCPGAAPTTACPRTAPRSHTARSSSCSSTRSLSPPASRPPRPRPRAWLSDSWELVHPSGSGGVYANFPDPDLPDEHRAYWGGNLERVRSVKEKYDPERVFG